MGEGGELSFDTDLDEEPPARSYREGIDRLLAAFARPGRLESTYSMPWGPATGVQLIGFELIETVVHSWDIARGLGVGLEVDDDVVRATLAGARLWVDDSVRVPGMFGPEVAVSAAPLLDELVAFLGRDPGSA